MIDHIYQSDLNFSHLLPPGGGDFWICQDSQNPNAFCFWSLIEIYYFLYFGEISLYMNSRAWPRQYETQMKTEPELDIIRSRTWVYCSLSLTIWGLEHGLVLELELDNIERAGRDFYLFPRVRSFLSRAGEIKCRNEKFKLCIRYPGAGGEIFTIQFDEIAPSLEENMWPLFS